MDWKVFSNFWSVVHPRPSEKVLVRTNPDTAHTWIPNKKLECFTDIFWCLQELFQFHRLFSCCLHLCLEPPHFSLVGMPSFIKSPDDQTGISGGVASFVCQAVGDPKPRITWMKKGKKVSSQRFEVEKKIQIPVWCSRCPDLSLLTFTSH